MSGAREVLRTRCKEILAMRRFLLRAESNPAGLETFGMSRTDSKLVEHSTKAAFMMMLYNLAEAVVVSSIHEVFDRVQREGLAFDQVAVSVRNFWINRRASQIKQSSVDSVSELIREVVDSVLKRDDLSAFASDEIRKLYPGNVDGRLIKDITSELSISILPRGSSHGGSRLLEVKTIRNELGHGTYSFSEVGASKSAPYLREASIRVRRFLTDAVVAFEKFFRDRAYALSSSALAATTAASRE